MTEQPTPGPWELVQSHGGVQRIHAENGPLRVCVAIVHSLPDAHLLAAAPDLLAALKAARRFAITAIQANVDLPDFDPAEHSLVKKIDAALAKAEPSP